MSLSVHDHRDGPADMCPCCDFKQEGLDWLRCRIEAYPPSKPGRTPVVSRCPRCGRRSWAHFDTVTYEAIVSLPDAAVTELEVPA